MLGFLGSRLFQAIALFAAIASAIYAWNRYTASLVNEGYERGVAEVRAEVSQRDNVQLNAVIAELRSAEARASAVEQRARDQLAAERAKHTKEKEDADKRTEELVAAARAGTLVLRDPGGDPAGPAGGGERAAGADRAAGFGAGATGGAGLSVAAATFLLELTGQADLEAFRYNRLLSAYGTLEESCREDR